MAEKEAQRILASHFDDIEADTELHLELGAGRLIILDALQLVLYYLVPRDIIALGISCKLLKEVVQGWPGWWNKLHVVRDLKYGTLWKQAVMELRKHPRESLRFNEYATLDEVANSVAAGWALADIDAELLEEFECCRYMRVRDIYGMSIDERNCLYDLLDLVMGKQVAKQISTTVSLIADWSAPYGMNDKKHYQSSSEKPKLSWGVPRPAGTLETPKADLDTPCDHCGALGCLLMVYYDVAQTWDSAAIHARGHSSKFNRVRQEAERHTTGIEWRCSECDYYQTTITFQGYIDMQGARGLCGNGHMHYRRTYWSYRN